MGNEYIASIPFYIICWIISGVVISLNLWFTYSFILTDEHEDEVPSSKLFYVILGIVLTFYLGFIIHLIKPQFKSFISLLSNCCLNHKRNKFDDDENNWIGLQKTPPTIDDDRELQQQQQEKEQEDEEMRTFAL